MKWKYKICKNKIKVGKKRCWKICFPDNFSFLHQNKYCNDQIMFESLETWEWCQTLFRLNLKRSSGLPSRYEIWNK